MERKDTEMGKTGYFSSFVKNSEGKDDKFLVQILVLSLVDATLILTKYPISIMNL